MPRARLLAQPGVVEMFWATICFVIMKVLVKMMPAIPIAEVILFRSAFTFVFSFVVLKIQKQYPWGQPKHRPLLLLRGIGGAMAFFLYFYLIRQVPLASAYSIQYLAPIFTTIIAYFWLKERIGNIECILFVVAFLGILMIHGFDLRVSVFELIIGISATICMAFTYVVIRQLRNKESPLTVVFYFSVVTLPIVLAYLPWYWVDPKGYEWLLLLMMAVATQAAQYYSAKAAFLAGKLSRVAVVSYVGIVFAIIAGFFFGEQHSAMAYLGMAVVVASVLLSLYFKKSK